MTTRKFYKTIIKIEILSEERIPDDMTLEEIGRETIEGGYSGRTLETKESELNGKQAATALIKQSSSPEFFRIDEKGNDI